MTSALSGLPAAPRSHRIARQQKAAAASVQDRQSEHPVEALEEVNAFLLVEMGKHFAIRIAAKTVSLLFEFPPQRTMVVDLAVAYNSHGFVLTEQRLRSVLRVDNAESANRYPGAHFGHDVKTVYWQMSN